MKILVINAGSSSLKCQYFIGRKNIASILIERIGEKESHATLTYEHHTITHEKPVKDHHEALTLLRALFKLSGVLKDFSYLDAIGHRVVHGGEHFSTPVRITPDVIKTIESLIPLAPLHNRANLAAIQAFRRAYPNIPQVAVFDTAFHQSMPPYAYHYAIPLSLKEQYHIRRYGFHGTSHSYVAKEAAEYLSRPLENLNLITLHLGNGASACAIQNGKSIDTSMGFTPLEGLVMGTRSGDLDPAILPYLENQGYTTAQINHLLNNESGLLGIGGSNDMREILSRCELSDPNALLALDIFVYRIQKYIGAYAIVLGALDAIVFTGGIGEHASPVRHKICEGLGILGIKYEKERNASLNGISGSFHTKASRTALLVIPTNEELEIATACKRVLA